MLRKLGLVLGLIVAVVLGNAASAKAGWGHARGGSWGSSGGSSGSWGGNYHSYSHGSWGGSSGYGGSSGGWGHHGLFHHRKHAHGSWGGSSGYSYGGSGGSSGYSYGGSSGYGGGSSGYSAYAPSYGSWGGSSGGAVIHSGSSPVMEGTPVESAPTPPTPPTPPTGTAPATGTGTSNSLHLELEDAAMINVNVPANAMIFVNGNQTKSTGEMRQFVSRGLTRGQQYTYELRMEIDGKIVDTRTVRLTTGQRIDLNLGTDVNAEPVAVSTAKPVKTTVIVNVPENAKVFLAGQETSQTGARREFTTSKLPAGQAWENYTIRVEAMVDGELRTAEKTLTVYAGDDRVVDLDLAKGTDESVARTAANN